MCIWLTTVLANLTQAKAEAAKDISKYQEEQEGKLAELAQQESAAAPQ